MTSLCYLRSRRIVRRTAAALFVAALAGCSSVATPGAGGRHPWTLPGHVRIGSSDEPDSLNPMYAHTDATDQLTPLLFAPLFRYDARGEFVPELATEVPTARNGGISADSKTIVLHFRRNVTWADGAPLDARDFRFTWHAVMNPHNSVKQRTGWDDIRAIDLRDGDHTAVLHLREPSVAVLGILGEGGGSAVPPLPEHLLGHEPSLDRAAFNAAPLASGPFTLERWSHGSSLEFVANPRYWRGRPRLDRISWKIVPNSETLLAQLQTHEIDVYPDVVENQIERARTVAGVALDHRVLANVRHLEFNTRRPALHDVRVRLAIAEAVDWARMNRTIYHGVNERARSDVVPTSWAAPNLPFYPYDPRGAARLLDAAGFAARPGGVRARADGTALRLTISTGTNKPQNEQAEIAMQQELRAVGIELSVKNYPVSLLFARDGPLYGGSCDLSWTIQTNGPDPDNEFLWASYAMPPNGANTTFLNDAEVTRDAHYAARTFDRARRTALYLDEERRLHALAPAIFLYWQNGFSAYDDDLKNYRPAQYISDQWNAYEWSI